MRKKIKFHNCMLNNQIKITRGHIAMSKFEEMNKNQDSIVNKEIDAYLKKNGFIEEGKHSTGKQELQRVYSERGVVTYVSVMENRVYIFREDEVAAFLSDKFYNFEEDTTESIENFRDFMDNIYQEIF